MTPTEQLLEIADKIRGWVNHMKKEGCSRDGPSAYKMEHWAESIEEAVAELPQRRSFLESFFKD